MKTSKIIIRKIGFLSAFILPALLVAGYYQGGIGYFYPLIFAFVCIPLMDYYVGEDRYNVPKELERILSTEQYYRLITHSWAYLQVILLVWACWAVAQDPGRPWYEWLGFTLSTGVVTGGIGITVAHELGHKNNRYDQWMAQLILMTVCYMHFFIEHNHGHHVHVATPKDPATARRGESFYRFWWRTVTGSFRSAWNIEKERLTKAGKPAWSAHNRMLWYMVLPLLYLAFLFGTVSLLVDRLAWEVIPFFFAQSIVAFSLLEVVNYVEHYGLQRRQLSNGRYERVRPIHSWNASHMISNFFLFQLQRHSDHHAYASRPYQILRHFDESPQLPAGYPTMILLALVPPLWFRVMDAKMDEWQRSYGAPPAAA
ncbi:MAG: alkane 1-monooxygenase [Thermonema sp.]|uniref:alkane 1-monooxygenase n=1 Tax=Thermonema sp. TaxID=2231181 RepID=UPI0021DE9900|nr:alkane 1-monooxygenase [Thermonema sp.]GIV40276.1 MAG: alkane 1-monooxygenase [Thermonema sp.]